MANSYYETGEINANKTTKVEDRIFKIKEKDLNYEKAFKKQNTYARKEVGIKHSNGSRLKIHDNGNIELFARNEAGIIVNKEYKTTNLYGDAINMNASLIRINTRPNGLMWNGYNLNPMLYQLSSSQDLKLMGEIINTDTGAVESIKISPFIKNEEDIEFKKHLDNLGIPY